MRCIGLASLTALLFALGTSVPVLAQDDLDSVKVDPAHHKVVFENGQVRVVRWEIAPGDKTLNHSHPNNLNINLTDYNGRVTAPDGKTSDIHAKAGSVGWREAGVHVVENIGDQPMEGIIVEPKKPASARPPGSADPVVVDPSHQKVEFENEQIRVIREYYEPGEKIPTLDEYKRRTYVPRWQNHRSYRKSRRSAVAFSHATYGTGSR
jgi:quercetin dioxygenase-like cupin family protein